MKPIEITVGILLCLVGIFVIYIEYLMEKERKARRRDRDTK